MLEASETAFLNFCAYVLKTHLLENKVAKKLKNNDEGSEKR